MSFYGIYFIFPNSIRLSNKKGYAFILIFVFLSPFIIAIGAVWYIGYTTETKVENYFSQNKCEQIYNFKAKYKALCQNDIVVIKDLFIANFESNENIVYKNIQNLEKSDEKIIIQHQNRATTLEFENSSDSASFFNQLEKRIRP